MNINLIDEISEYQICDILTDSIDVTSDYCTNNPGMGQPGTAGSRCPPLHPGAGHAGTRRRRRCQRTRSHKRSNVDDFFVSPSMLIFASGASVFSWHRRASVGSFSGKHCPIQCATVVDISAGKDQWRSKKPNPGSAAGCETCHQAVPNQLLLPPAVWARLEGHICQSAAFLHFSGHAPQRVESNRVAVLEPDELGPLPKVIRPGIGPA